MPGQVSVHLGVDTGRVAVCKAAGFSYRAVAVEPLMSENKQRWVVGVCEAHRQASPHSARHSRLRRAHMVMAYAVRAYIVMACTMMAYTVMVYKDMAYILIALGSAQPTKRCVPTHVATTRA